MSRLRLPLKTGTALLWLALAACATNKPAAPPETVVPEDGSGQIEPDTRRALPRHRWTRHSSPCLQVDTVSGSPVDETRDYLYKMTCQAALWLDGTVGYRADRQAAKKTHGNLTTSFEYSEFNGFDSGTSLRIYTELPSAGNRLNAFIGFQPNNEDETRNRSDTFALRSQFSQGADDGEWLAGLGYKIPQLDRFDTDIRVGLTGLSQPKLYVNSRSRINLYADEENILAFQFKPFWTNRDGFGLTGKLDFSRVLKQGLLLRLSEVGTVSQKTEGLDWYSGIILYQRLTDETGFAWQLFVRGETDEPVPLYEYGGQVAFRTPILKGKLLSELRFGYSFPKTDPEKDREGSASAGLSLTLPFGGG